jgi:signal transduction histidine kinase
MSLRLRLTLLYTSLLAFIWLAVSAGVYLSQARRTLDDHKTALRLAAQSILSGAPADLDALPLPPALEGGLLWVQTRGPDGAVIHRAQLPGTAELPAADPAVLAEGQPALETESVEGEDLLIYSVPVVVQGESRGMLQVAQSLESRNHSLQALAKVLLLGSALGCLLALAAGGLAADMALQPISHLTTIAREIGAGRDFLRRVEYDGPDDEIGRLAATFNGMLAELQAAQLETEQALQAQQRFLGDVSHELRTPLTTIRGNLDLLQRTPPIPEADRAEVLSDMAAETERLMRLVTDVLNLARSEAQSERPREVVPLAPLLEDLARQSRLLAPERMTEWQAPDGLAVLADPDAVKQVLLILLDNAFKHTPPDARVSVAATADDREVAVQVHDTGPGIDRAALSRVFDRFYRGDAARSAPGVGLGLPIAKMLVETQRGTITVESPAGAGTTFTVMLPRATANDGVTANHA